MSSKRERQRVWPAAGVLAISVLAHVALLFLPLPGPRHETAGPEPSSLRVELVARQLSPETPAQTPEPPQSPERAPEEPTEPDRTRPDQTADFDETSSSEPAPPASATSPAAAAAQPRAGAIQAQLLSAARNLGRESAQSEDGRGLTYQRVPDLPSQPGWLHQYTGRVTSSVDRWQGNDGSRSARWVTGSGQVLCVRTRAPTAAEIFNPWMSTAVAMVHGCGREKPEAPAPNDAWVRRPGADGK